MKTLLKVIVGVVLLAVVAAGCLVGYLFLAFPKADPPAAITVEATPERLARGEYLAAHVSSCIDCHSTRDFRRYSGPIVPGTEGMGGQRFGPDNAGMPGTLYAKNITPAAIGSWSDGELLRAMTSGVSKDGTALFPLMPYPHIGRMSEDDLHAIVAYVRSLRAIANDVPPRSLAFPMNIITRTIPGPADVQPRPPAEDKVRYGEYLVNAASCTECHTPVDGRGQPLPGMQFAGGAEFRPTPAFRVRSANITPDADSGIGAWTEAQFIDKFKGFETPSDHVLSEAEQRQNTVMPWVPLAGMTREDLAAIYAYLRTLPPVVHRVTKFPDQLEGGAP